MKKSVITFCTILTLGSMVVSCSHQEPASQDAQAARYKASENCPVKGEYHAYFDQVEKCMEKENQK